MGSGTMGKRAGALAICALLALGAAPAWAATPTLASGVYDDTLLLAVDTSGRVSGYFDMSQPGPPAISCIFYLQGQLAGPVAILATYFPEDPKGDAITGALVPPAPGKVQIMLQKEHGGCGNVWPFADKDNPADFTLQKAEPWISVRVVRADRAYFSASPGAAHGRAYLVKGDGVGVRAAQGGWDEADFVGETRTSSGWLRESDLYPP